HSEDGMLRTHAEVVRPQIQCTEFLQIFRSQTRKFIEQLPYRLAFDLIQVSPTIEAFKSFGLGKLPHAGHPIDAFTVNQMAAHVERAPGVFTFVAKRPGLRQMAKKRIESSGSASEKRYRVLQVVVGHDLSIHRQTSSRDFG